MELSKFSLAGTKTLENLGKAFAGEAQARNRYTFYANEARKIGYPVLEEVFLETSEQEKGHAEIFYDFLTIGADVPAIDLKLPIAKARGFLSTNKLPNIHECI